jgi:hypothetical protein
LIIRAKKCIFADDFHTEKVIPSISFHTGIIKANNHAMGTTMEKNTELRQAWDFVEHTGRSIFLTGKAERVRPRS